MSAHHAAAAANNQDAAQQQPQAAQQPVRNAGAFFGVNPNGVLGTNAVNLTRGRFLGY